MEDKGTSKGTHKVQTKHKMEIHKIKTNHGGVCWECGVPLNINCGYKITFEHKSKLKHSRTRGLKPKLCIKCFQKLKNRILKKNGEI